jgi:hypothetical protein
MEENIMSLFFNNKNKRKYDPAQPLSSPLIIGNSETRGRTLQELSDDQLNAISAWVLFSPAPSYVNNHDPKFVNERQQYNAVRNFTIDEEEKFEKRGMMTVTDAYVQGLIKKLVPDGPDAEVNGESSVPVRSAHQVLDGQQAQIPDVIRNLPKDHPLYKAFMDGRQAAMRDKEKAAEAKKPGIDAPAASLMDVFNAGKMDVGTALSSSDTSDVPMDGSDLADLFDDL